MKKFLKENGIIQNQKKLIRDLQRRYARRIRLTTSLILRIIVFFAIIATIVTKNWVILFLSVLTFFLTFLPSILKRNFKVHLPVEFELIMVMLLFLSIFLGEVHDYYTKFFWWDVLLHSSFSIALGFIGFLIMLVLYYDKRIKTSPTLIAVFSFCFAVALGAIWEVFEFSMDGILGYRHFQKSGLMDTMWDIIVDCIGAFIASVLGYFYIKGRRRGIFDRFVQTFVRNNPHLFDK